MPAKKNVKDKARRFSTCLKPELYSFLMQLPGKGVAQKLTFAINQINGSNGRTLSSTTVKQINLRLKEMEQSIAEQRIKFEGTVIDPSTGTLVLPAEPVKLLQLSEDLPKLYSLVSRFNGRLRALESVLPSFEERLKAIETHKPITQPSTSAELGLE